MHAACMAGPAEEHTRGRTPRAPRTPRIPPEPNCSRASGSDRLRVRDGLAEGMSVNEMQAILQGVTTLDSTGKMLYAFSPARALAIARTESTRAVNAGGVKTWESAAAQAGVVVNFRWLSQPGARDEHAKLHNKLREPDGFWYGGGVKGSAPGNFVGSKKATAAMNINCRCTFTPEIT